MKTLKLKVALVGAALFAAAASQLASAASINLGQAGNYVILSVAVNDNGTPSTGGAGQATGSLIINSSSGIVGNVGISAYTDAPTLQKATLDGNLVVDPNATYNSSKIGSNFILTSGHSVVTQSLNQAVLDAVSAYNFYAALIPAINSANDLHNITSSVVVNGTGLGQNVYRVGTFDLNNASLTINGSATDTFIFDVTGTFDMSHAQILLSGGVTANNILFNFIGGSAADHADLIVTANKADNDIIGTFLAPYRTVIYHNPANFNGRIIAQDIDVHSDFWISMPGNAVPLPSAVWGGMALMTSLGLVSRIRKAKASRVIQN